MRPVFREFIYLGEVCFTVGTVCAFLFVISALIFSYPLWAAALILSAIIVTLVNVI